MLQNKVEKNNLWLKEFASLVDIGGRRADFFIALFSFNECSDSDTGLSGL